MIGIKFRDEESHIFPTASLVLILALSLLDHSMSNDLGYGRNPPSQILLKFSSLIKFFLLITKN